MHSRSNFTSIRTFKLQGLIVFIQWILRGISQQVFAHMLFAWLLLLIKFHRIFLLCFCCVFLWWCLLASIWRKLNIFKVAPCVICNMCHVCGLQCTIVRLTIHLKIWVFEYLSSLQYLNSKYTLEQAVSETWKHESMCSNTLRLHFCASNLKPENFANLWTNFLHFQHINDGPEIRVKLPELWTAIVY